MVQEFPSMFKICFLFRVIMSYISLKCPWFFEYIKLILTCRHSHQSVVSAALRVVGNIVTGDDYQTQVGACILQINYTPLQ